MMPFSSLHPAVAALYFASLLTMTMFVTHPICVGIALLGAVLFFAVSGRRSLRDSGVYVVLFVIVSLTNPLFSHNGVTPLFFLNGNPVTLEAVLYGVQLAAMLTAVVCWFKCWNVVMTDDKLLFLFGKISPKLALLISSALRFIPLFKTQAERIRRSQKAMGLYASDTWTDKLKGTVRVYSSLITWALENAIDTGASMKARGYGLPGRTHYARYLFRAFDAWMLVAVLLLDGIVIAAQTSGRLAFAFYPAITVIAMDGYGVTAVAAFTMLSLLPFILEVKEGLQWRYYRSRI